MVRRSLGDLEAAADLLRRATASKPDDANLRNSLGVVLREQGQTIEAIQCFDRALQLQADHADAHLNRGLALLQIGRLKAGWTEYEWRQQDAFPQPRWNGESLVGKTILVHGEQSLAEELLFAGCYEDLIARAAECIIVCDPRVERLFKRSFPAAKVFPVVRGGEAQWRMPDGLRCDVQVPAGSLPLHLRTSTTDFPWRRHFLTADPARVATWRQRYAATGEGLKIGLAWRNTAQPTTGSGETFTEWQSLVQWASGLSNDVQWINLQDGPDAMIERAAIQAELGIAIHDWPDAQSKYDLDDMAARIAALDLVISVGGVPAHLTGSLGAPAWVLVRQTDEWRWLTGGSSIADSASDSTPWYSSVRLFRAGTPAGAIKPIAILRDELLKQLAIPAEENGMQSIGSPHWNRNAAPQRTS
jgi:hypothetical protein